MIYFRKPTHFLDEYLAPKQVEFELCSLKPSYRNRFRYLRLAVHLEQLSKHAEERRRLNHVYQHGHSPLQAVQAIV